MESYVKQYQSRCASAYCPRYLISEFSYSVCVCFGRLRRLRERSLSRRRTWTQITGRSFSGTITSSSRRIWPATWARARESANRSTTMMLHRRIKVPLHTGHTHHSIQSTNPQPWKVLFNHCYLPLPQSSVYHVRYAGTFNKTSN